MGSHWLSFNLDKLSQDYDSLWRSPYKFWQQKCWFYAGNITNRNAYPVFHLVDFFTKLRHFYSVLNTNALKIFIFFFQRWTIPSPYYSPSFPLTLVCSVWLRYYIVHLVSPNEFFIFLSKGIVLQLFSLIYSTQNYYKPSFCIFLVLPWVTTQNCYSW